ncbi:MAG: alpha/beta hydrolase, partial [Pseudomonadota bacterium]
VDPEAARSPVFTLPGGPGSEWDHTDPIIFDHLEKLRNTRDYIFVTQRGNTAETYTTPDLTFASPAAFGPGDVADVDNIAAVSGEAYRAALSEWTARGVDVTGYDITNIVDDVYDIKNALGYDDIVLRGCSFGSQWSFSYIKRWPETVDRALLSGVEPLDYAYDSADWLVASMDRLSASAADVPALKARMPEGGLTAAIAATVERLETEPAEVILPTPDGGTVTVAIGPDDVRTTVRYAWGLFEQDTDYANLAFWPRFVLELYEGDYRVLAFMKLAQLQDDGRGKLLGPLIDNSLGISPERDAKLLAEKGRDILEPNWFYRATRDAEQGAPQVPLEFLEDFPNDIPTLLVSGDYDWSTPIENAEAVLPSLEQGHLVTVAGATHCPLFQSEQILADDPEAADRIFSFIDLDFSETPASEFFATLPDRVELNPVPFDDSEVSLFDQFIASGGLE